MKYLLIFISAVLFFGCNSDNDFELISEGQATNNSFHFSMYGEDNVIKFSGENSSPYYLLCWDMQADTVGNNIMAVYNYNFGRKGLKTEFEFISKTFKLDSIQFLNYNLRKTEIVTDSSIIMNYLDFDGYDTDIHFVAFFHY